MKNLVDPRPTGWFNNVDCQNLNDNPILAWSSFEAKNKCLRIGDKKNVK